MSCVFSLVRSNRLLIASPAPHLSAINEQPVRTATNCYNALLAIPRSRISRVIPINESYLVRERQEREYCIWSTSLVCACPYHVPSPTTHRPWILADAQRAMMMRCILLISTLVSNLLSVSSVSVCGCHPPQTTRSLSIPIRPRDGCTTCAAPTTTISSHIPRGVTHRRPAFLSPGHEHRGYLFAWPPLQSSQFDLFRRCAPDPSVSCAPAP